MAVDHIIRSGRWTAWYGTDLVYDVSVPDKVTLVVENKASIDIPVSKEELHEIFSCLGHPMALLDCFPEDIDYQAVPFKPVTLAILGSESPSDLVVFELFDTEQEAMDYADRFCGDNGLKESEVIFYVLPSNTEMYIGDQVYPPESRYIPRM